MDTSVFETSRLAAGSGEWWDRGTRAAFLDAIGDGSLPREAFDRWLVQDCLFVQGFASWTNPDFPLRMTREG